MTGSPTTAASMAQDTDLVARAKAGEALAFEWIMRRYNRRLFRIAYSMLKNAPDAEDAVQEAYVRAFTALHTLGNPQSLPTWLTTILVNEARGRLRRARRFDPLEPGMGDGSGEPASPIFTEAPETPERLAFAGELRRVLEAAIEALPGPFRTVFMLRGVEQMSVEETAQCLGIPAATVKTRFHRARALLRARLQAEAEYMIPDIFPFDGARCDRIIERVQTRLGIAPR